MSAMDVMHSTIYKNGFEDGQAALKQSALDALKNAWSNAPYNEYYGLEKAVDTVTELPPIQPKTGHWILTEHWDGTYAKCSECGFEIMVNEPGNGLKNVDDLHFCSGCGSKMEEVSE